MLVLHATLVCHESPQENIACHKSFHEKNSLREMTQMGPTLKNENVIPIRANHRHHPAK